MRTVHKADVTTTLHVTCPPDPSLNSREQANKYMGMLGPMQDPVL